ncbi:hypothetical protein L1887_28446 [Cichorium endivia]|nr:hypothetical protein L1887_28446 [Cichorium endivia]
MQVCDSLLLQFGYTFGPTFRAENSNTSRHLAEFWMIEPELVFVDLNDDMACATVYLAISSMSYVKYVLENCKEDMEFFNTWIEKGIIDRLSDVVEKSFVRLTYTDAVELLLKSKKKFDFTVGELIGGSQREMALLNKRLISFHLNLINCLHFEEYQPIEG